MNIGYVLLLLLTLQAPTAQPQVSSGLPVLNSIRTATLGPSYSCRKDAPRDSGYGATALFLSERPSHLGPDLLFNGACGAPDYFEASTSGDDMALIADLGPGLRVEDVTSARAFNYARVASPENYTRFAEVAPIVEGHTYVVLLNKSVVRGLYVFTVTAHDPNRSVSIRYAVKSYQILCVADQSRGFDWDATNIEPAAAPVAATPN